MRLKIIPQITNIKEPINNGDKIIFKFGLVITQKKYTSCRNVKATK
tara:strand:- start:240 stop:377 length:138 start_codon:yes stop_codon:yes gene_type:complete